MTNKVEAAVMRSRLKLRKTVTTMLGSVHKKLEVYTTIHGSTTYRWVEVTEPTYNWYKGEFSKKHNITIPEEVINNVSQYDSRAATSLKVA